MKAKMKVLCVVAAVLAVITAAYAAVSAGSSSDPLVTLSYLTGKFTPQMQTQMEELVDQKADELTRQFEQAASGAGSSGSAVFSVVTLSKGQVLVGDVGCEILLRVGSASCQSDGSTGLIDVTSGGNLGNGKALEKNHLYMVTISTRSVVAGADSVKLLVRGPYTVQ